MNDLEQRLLKAHAAQDQAALVALYREASETALGLDAKGFYLTQAYVYALESGDAAAAALKADLQALGREQ